MVRAVPSRRRLRDVRGGALAVLQRDALLGGGGGVLPGARPPARGHQREEPRGAAHHRDPREPHRPPARPQHHVRLRARPLGAHRASPRHVQRRPRTSHVDGYTSALRNVSPLVAEPGRQVFSIISSPSHCLTTKKLTSRTTAELSTSAKDLAVLRESGLRSPTRCDSIRGRADHWSNEAVLPPVQHQRVWPVSGHDAEQLVEHTRLTHTARVDVCICTTTGAAVVHKPAAGGQERDVPLAAAQPVAGQLDHHQ